MHPNRPVAVLVFAALLVLAGCAGSPVPSPTATATPESPSGAREGTVVTVVDVADGDTIDVRYPNGTRATVRLLGVDTPEVWVETQPSEYPGVPDTERGRRCLRKWGHVASNYTTDRLAGERVRIVVGGDGRGSYGRLLAYVYVNGTNHNYRLVERGLARVYRTEFSQLGRFLAAQERARNATRGLWNCARRSTFAGTLAVVRVHADAAGTESANLNDEYVVFENRANRTLDLGGWTVVDAAGHRYRFPDGTTLAPGARLVLHTGNGTNGGGDYYWDADGPVWNNGGDVVIVYDAAGEVVVRDEYD